METSYPGVTNTALTTTPPPAWTAIESDPCQASSPTLAPGDHGAQAGDPGDCPDSVPPGQRLQWKIPDLVSITVDFESVSASVEGEGLIASVVSGEHTFTGETTIFGGAKAGVELGPFRRRTAGGLLRQVRPKWDRGLRRPSFGHGEPL